MGKEFGDRVSLLLEQQGISQREIAGILGITEATISRYIKGEREPKPEMTSIFSSPSRYLKVKLSALFSGCFSPSSIVP